MKTAAGLCAAKKGSSQLIALNRLDQIDWMVFMVRPLRIEYPGHIIMW